MHKDHIMTDEQIFAALKSVDPDAVRLPTGFRLFARAILQAATREAPSADAVDAQRYRWMRWTFIDDDKEWPSDVAYATTGELLDAAIDKAIAASAPKGYGND